ncbi:hypothetical protein KY284_032463 [Solanum tuberosum]|nr:hypothetical protein KY284_032463 [Solanum tuberosum]
MIKWIKSSGTTWKLYTDGSYIKNQDKAGAGGILRNKIMSMILAFSYPTQFCTNNYSEAQVALIGISWCSNQWFEALEVELDSTIVVQMINGICKPHWRILVKYCYREASEVADALAKYATQIQDPKIILQEVDLPEVTKGLLRMNKLNFSTFRRRAKKTNT